MQGKCMFWSGLGGVLQCKHMGRGVEKSLLECCMKRGKGWHPCGSRLGRGPVSSSSTLFFTFSGFQSPLARKLQMRPWRGRGGEGPVISYSHFEQLSSDSGLSTLKHLLSPHRTVPVTSQPCGKSVLGILRGQRGGKSAAEHWRELGVTHKSFHRTQQRGSISSRTKSQRAWLCCAPGFVTNLIDLCITITALFN